MIVDPLKTGLLWACLTILALVAYLVGRAVIRLRARNWSPRRQWQVFAAASILALLPGAVYLELFQPLGGIHGREAANYWIGRAARDGDRSVKESHVARIALSSEYGSHIAMQAIASIEDKRERCLLRSLLAGLPEVRNPLERQQEARQECAGVQDP